LLEEKIKNLKSTEGKNATKVKKTQKKQTTQNTAKQ